MNKYIEFENEPAVDIAGLPPARAALAIHRGKIERLKDQIAMLESGRTKLDYDLKKVDDEKAQLERLISADAHTLVQKLKSGAAWALSQFGGQQVIDLSARLSASSHHATIARRALQATDDEIQTAKRQLDELESRTHEIIGNALEEAAAGITQDYESAIHSLYESMIALLALERFMCVDRVGRTVCVLPDFSHQTIMREMAVPANSADISDALQSWKAFANDLKVDPRTPISALKFNPVRPDVRPDSIAYEAMHPVEQRAIDVDRALGL